MIAAASLLPTVKDQARSVTAPATHPPTQNTKFEDLDYKDQARTVHPPPLLQQERDLPSAQGTPVSTMNQDSSTVIAVVLETIDGVNNGATTGEQMQHPKEENHHREPSTNGQTTVQKHRIWAIALVVAVAVVVAGVVIAVVVAGGGSSSSDGGDAPLVPPSMESPPLGPAESPTLALMVFSWQETKLTASDAAAGDVFGRGVAISNDTIVVGAAGFDDANGTDSGSIYVFTRTGTIWTEQANLTASDGAAKDLFGEGVAIAGNTIVVGSYGDDDKGEHSGSAYVFTRMGTTWTKQAKLTASDGAAEDMFGRRVAISNDTIVVGGAHWDDNDNCDRSGSAYVFTGSGTNWTEQAKLTASDGAVEDYFGGSVAIAEDTIVVGADGDNDKGEHSGSAYVFTRTGTTWTEQAKLTASDGAAEDLFGRFVAISNDTIVVGAHWDDNDNGDRSGSAYVFTHTGTTWTEQAKLTASDGEEGDRFGGSVAIAGDTIVVGAYWASGSLYIFTRTGTTWTQQDKLMASDGAVGDYFGISLAFADDTIVVGAVEDNDDGDKSGSTYIYDIIN